MGSKKKYNRQTIRSGNNINKDKDIGVFLYGRLGKISSARVYCKFHQCYLNGNDIAEKKCNFKKCKFRQEL